jgi:hypothetical protein
MQFLKLDPHLQSRFEKLPETGMGFHYVLARYAQYPNEAGFVIAGATFAIPVSPYGSLTSISELTESTDLDEIADAEPTPSFIVVQDFEQRNIDARFLLFAELRRLAFGGILPPVPPIPPPGTPLVLKAKTTGEDAFLRFAYTSHDPRTRSNRISAGTYATTYLDGAGVTSGFSAVARYALPVPLAARYVTLLTPPKGTLVHLGAAGPLFGQSGGGVEAYFPNAFTNAARPFTVPPY